LIKAFEQKDIEGFIYEPTIDNQIFGFLGDLDNRNIPEQSITISVFNDDKLLGIGGVLPFWSGVGEAWMLVTPELKKCPMRALKDIQFYFNYLFEKEGFKRIQSVVAVDFTLAHRFIMKLGFVPEGIMPNYGPKGEHFTRYVRFS
jgi:hypothetical protein